MQILDTSFQNKAYPSERLLRTLDMVFQYPLTVVVAPANAGKTLAVQEYLRQGHASHANSHWYTACGEPLSITWKGLCSVFGNIDKTVAEQLRAVEMPAREWLPEIGACMQRIHCDVPTVLVIDNYHLVQSDAAFGLIAALAQHTSEQLHIVIITQRFEEDRKTPLSTLRIGKVDASSFLLDELEAPQYFQEYGFPRRAKAPVRHRMYDYDRAWPATDRDEAKDFTDWLVEELWVQSRTYGPLVSFSMMILIAESISPRLARMYYSIFQACTKAMAANPEKAKVYLKKALDIAMPDPMYLLFSEQGMGLQELMPETYTRFPAMQSLERAVTVGSEPKVGAAKPTKSFYKAHQALTPRERQIAQLAKAGRTNKEIGKALFISPETVKMAMKKIFKKLDIHSRYQL